MKKYLIFLVCLLMLCAKGRAEQQTFGITEKLGSKISEELFVLDTDSLPASLTTLIDRPTLLVLVYYHCPTLCPKMLDGVVELINYTSAIPGTDYQIITLSIDHKENTQLAKSSMDYYNKKLKNTVNPEFWRFYTADSVTIQKLTMQTGWEFRNINGEIIHTTSSVLLTPKGMISQYFYGTYFNYMHFAMSVDMAADEELIPTRLKNLKYCYNFTPTDKNYVSTITKLFGLVIILLVGGMFFYLRFVDRKPLKN